VGGGGGGGGGGGRGGLGWCIRGGEKRLRGGVGGRRGGGPCLGWVRGGGGGVYACPHNKIRWWLGAAKQAQGQFQRGAKRRGGIWRMLGESKMTWHNGFETRKCTFALVCGDMECKKAKVGLSLKGLDREEENLKRKKNRS